MSDDESWNDLDPVEITDLEPSRQDDHSATVKAGQGVGARSGDSHHDRTVRPSRDRRLHPLPGFSRPSHDDGEVANCDAEEILDSAAVSEPADDIASDNASDAGRDGARTEPSADAVDDGSNDVIIEPEAAPEEESRHLPTRWLAAILVSLVLHTWMGSTLSSLQVEEPEFTAAAPIETRLAPVEPFPDEIKEIAEFELGNPSDSEKEQYVTVNARSVGLVLSDKPLQESTPELIEAASVAMNDAAPVYDIPEGIEVDEAVVVQGTTGEGLIQLDAALDRVTWEIASNLKERKVLIVWLLDASGSLMEQRKDVTARMRRIYRELHALESAGQVPNQDQPVLSAVVSFGLKTTFLTPNPTPNVDEVVRCLEKAPIDESGVENVFGAVKQVLDKWQGYRRDQGRRILIMTITDEAGDDYAQNLNTSISMLNRLGGKAYVIGPPAIFGKREGHIPYVAPEDGKTYQIPVDIGPESAMVENVQLPFWFNGPQYENLSSGLGPYALARLVHETGGGYFMTNMTTSAGLAATGTYDSQAMKMFIPDYQFGTPEDYVRSLEKHPLRMAVFKAGQLSLKYKVLGTPELELRVNPGNYLQQLATAQHTVAISSAMIDNIISVFNPNMEQAYHKEESLRWRMAYNLCYGRLLAQRLRCYEYNSALAQLKLLGSQDVATKSNHWSFRPDANINYAVGMKKSKDLAETLLQRCIKEAPGTPWAVLAARELQYPFGIKVVERFDKPPPPPSVGREPANLLTGKKKGVLLLVDEKKKKAPATKPATPPTPPKLPKF